MLYCIDRAWRSFALGHTHGTKLTASGALACWRWHGALCCTSIAHFHRERAQFAMEVRCEGVPRRAAMLAADQDASMRRLRRDNAVQENHNASLGRS